MPMITMTLNGRQMTVDTGGMTAQQYVDYYRGHGFNAQLVDQGGPGAVDQLQAFAAGQGAAPQGLVSALSGGGGEPSMSSPDPAVTGEIRVLMPDHSQQFFRINDPALDAALTAGARPVNADGSISTDVRQFNGGWIVRSGTGYVPLNVLSGGEWLPGQQEALRAGGLDVGQGGGPGSTPGPTPPPGSGPGGGQGPIPTGGGGNTPSGYANNGWMGNQNAQAPALSKDLEDALRELMQEARTQGLRGQEALTGLVDDYKNYLGFARSAAEQTFAKRDMLTDLLTGKVMPGIESALGTMNQATGLSPEAMAALRVNAIESPERAYQGQVEQLKTQLGQRGAFGGGALPGDAGAMIRGYAPLMQGRDATRSNLLANTILSDEQRKFDTLGLNRQTALGAMNTGAGLASSLANAYNPSALFGANEGALSGLLSTLGARTNSGFQGLNAAGGFANTLEQAQPTSFKNLLLASLLGTGGNILSDPDNWSKIGDFFSGLFGGGNNNSSTPTQNPGQLPIPGNPFPTNPAPGTPTTPPFVSSGDQPQTQPTYGAGALASAYPTRTNQPAPYSAPYQASSNIGGDYPMVYRR